MKKLIIFEAKKKDNEWLVVGSSTEVEKEKEEYVIAKIPYFLKHPKTVANHIANSLSLNKKFKLTDII